MHDGKYDALTERITCPPKLTAFFELNCTLSGMNFLQTLGLFDDPPEQNHPGYS